MYQDIKGWLCGKVEQHKLDEKGRLRMQSLNGLKNGNKDAQFVCLRCEKTLDDGKNLKYLEIWEKEKFLETVVESDEFLKLDSYEQNRAFAKYRIVTGDPQGRVNIGKSNAEYLGDSHLVTAPVCKNGTVKGVAVWRYDTYKKHINPNFEEPVKE